MVVGYNQSDASIGWFHFLSGMTLYYSDRNENTLDPLYSLSLPPGDSVPMISIKSTHTLKLGPPYSKCIKENHLSHFSTYTQGLDSLSQSRSLFTEVHSVHRSLTGWETQT